MTQAEEKQQAVIKLEKIFGFEHAQQFKRLPVKTLKAVIEKLTTKFKGQTTTATPSAPAPVSAANHGCGETN